ncbi:reductase [Pannonibacter phragmitetus]|uniref:2Fe-2S iron-sulfur cluster-binding protein n=1 Tax=Pannonibacter phragmitetus TaxID=121719 RepID=UPI00067D2BB8|nr:2Fe-2S iron-sulfur cluster-binding protein [Pannonibacter phragmitetus]KND18194.1 reductase [Pannonibacter phragmitetus]
MTKIHFISATGIETVIDARDGDSVMHAAILNDVEGILAECGGSMMCATCHCYVDPAWQDKVTPPSEPEAGMLASAASAVRETSRLSCQITVGPELEGLIIHLPEAQL